MNPERTQHGIKWGAANLSCGFDDNKKGWVTFLLDTPKYKGNQGLQIYVTKTGKVRIHDSRGEWSPPPK